MGADPFHATFRCLVERSLVSSSRLSPRQWGVREQAFAEMPRKTAERRRRRRHKTTRLPPPVAARGFAQREFASRPRINRRSPLLTDLPRHTENRRQTENRQDDHTSIQKR